MPSKAFSLGANSTIAAQAMLGTPATVNLTTAASGSSQNGYVATTDLQIVTTADGTNKSVTLPDPAKLNLAVGDSYIVVNSASGQTLSVFPPTGGNISGGGTNTAFSVANNKAAIFYLVSPTSGASVWTAILSA